MKYFLLFIRYVVVIFQRTIFVLSAGHFPPPFASSSVAVLNDNKILLIQRRDGFGLSLPGGFACLFEEIEDAAKREVKEETGIDIDIENFLMILSGKRKGTKINSVETIFTGVPKSNQTLKKSIEGTASWFDLDKIEKEKIAFDHYKVIKKIKEMKAVYASHSS